MDETTRANEPPNSMFRFGLAVLYVRLRFFAFLAALALLFLIWPWLSAAWERILAYSGTYEDDASVSGQTEFFCPMDPGVVSAWPAICPICNMDLIRRQKSDAQLLPEGVIARMQLSPYKLTLAGIRTVAVQEVSSQTEPPHASGAPSIPSPSGESINSEGINSKSVVKVPTTALVYRAEQPLVYVESMPGMFDAIPVALVRNEGSDYVVTGQLVPGQRVAAMGTLLLDAESRLKPNLSTQYFGASQPSLASSAPVLPSSQSALGKDSLSTEDQRLVDVQKICPITKAPLGSMGRPVIVEVGNRRIAICCAGCRSRVLAEPTKMIEWLEQQQRAAKSAEP